MHHGTGMAQWHPCVHATFHFLTAFRVPGTEQTFVPEWKALTSINYTERGDPWKVTYVTKSMVLGEGHCPVDSRLFRVSKQGI